MAASAPSSAPALASTTIIDLKQHFLNDQIRLLAAPLEPAEDWHERDDDDDAESEEYERRHLSRAVVREGVYRLNLILQHHSRALYSTQTIRYVAETIDRTYLAGQKQAEIDGNALAGEDSVTRAADLRIDEVIAKLPRRWPVGKGDAEDAAAFKVAQVDFDSGDDDDVAGRGQASAASRQQQRYKQLLRQLTQLSNRRQTTQLRLEQCRQLRRLLEPYRHPLVTVQPNILYTGLPLEVKVEAQDLIDDEHGQGNELAREISRMRNLSRKMENEIKALKDGHAQTGRQDKTRAGVGSIFNEVEEAAFQEDPTFKFNAILQHKR